MLQQSLRHCCKSLLRRQNLLQACQPLSLLLGANGVSATHVGSDFYATIYLRVGVPAVVLR